MSMIMNISYVSIGMIELENLLPLDTYSFDIITDTLQNIFDKIKRFDVEHEMSSSLLISLINKSWQLK